MIHDAPVYLSATYAERERVKTLGARWDGVRRSWYVPPGQSLLPFRPWLDAETRRRLDESTEPLLFDAPHAKGKGVRADDAADAGAGPAELEKYGAPPDNAPQMTVRAFLDGVRAAVLGRYDHDLWIIGQITSLKERRSMVIIELIDPETTATGGTHRLEIRAWKHQFSRLDGKLRAFAGRELAPGIHVRAKIRPEFDPRFHLGALLLDIDPSVTVGALELKLRRIREALKRDGLWDRNRSLPPPPDYCRIAVIHPVGASGLADFERDARTLQGLGLLDCIYIPATFEGVHAERSVLDALREAARVHAEAPLDALVIIRGGGSREGLLALATEPVARAVCLFPVPVITGLGHADDTTLLDEIAWQRCDTPSKAIAFVREAIRGRARAARDAFDRLVQTARLVLQKTDAETAELRRRVASGAEAQLMRLGMEAKRRYDTVADAAQRRRNGLAEDRRRIDVLRADIMRAAPRRLEDGRERLARFGAALASGARNQLAAAGERLHLQRRRIETGASRRIAELGVAVARNRERVQSEASRRLEIWRKSLDHAERLVRAMGPEATLKRGFALALGEDGAAIASAASAEAAERFRLRFRDGEIRVRTDRPPPPERKASTRTAARPKRAAARKTQRKVRSRSS